MHLKYEATHAETELKYGPANPFPDRFEIFQENLSFVQFATIQEKKDRQE